MSESMLKQILLLLWCLMIILFPYLLTNNLHWGQGKRLLSHWYDALGVNV